MAARAAVNHQQRGAAAIGKQKPAAVDGNNRRALSDIGNVFDLRGAALEGKLQQQISRPLTRSFCAQLLANAQAAAAANDKKSAAIIVEAAVKAKGCAKVAKEKVTVKPKPETIIEISPGTKGEKISPDKKAASKKHKQLSTRKVETLTSVLTARSKAACGLKTSKAACGLKTVDNIDAADINDQLAVVDYVEDIYKFYRLAEASSQVHNYMAAQVEINEKMRSILVNWLIEAHNRFELMPETLYLIIHIVDRYLSMKTVQRRELQLVGLAAVLIASKYEEVWAPEVNDLICISDCAYNREQILGMEKSILNKLEWSLTFPTPYVFLMRFLKAAAADEEMEHMVFFLAELALIEYSMIMYCPSMIAASAVYTAQCTLNKSHVWSETLKHHTGFSEMQLMDCSKKLVKYHLSAGGGKLRAVYNKYLCPQRRAVALIPPAEKLL